MLASRSPQRVKLLRDAGYTFECDPADIDEENYPRTLDGEGVARHLALAKARHVAARHPNEVVLAADTVVALGDELLGKPEDSKHAREMLGKLAGSTHQCITGVAIVSLRDKVERVDHVTSQVRMRPLTDDELDAYVRSGQWQGKAGGYGIQDDDPFVTRIDGSLSNIIGLPMERVGEMLLTLQSAQQ